MPWPPPASCYRNCSIHGLRQRSHPWPGAQPQQATNPRRTLRTGDRGTKTRVWWGPQRAGLWPSCCASSRKSRRRAPGWCLTWWPRRRRFAACCGCGSRTPGGSHSRAQWSGPRPPGRRHPPRPRRLPRSASSACRSASGASPYCGRHGPPATPSLQTLSMET